MNPITPPPASTLVPGAEPFTDEELLAALDGDLTPEEVAAPLRWTVEDDGSAEWALRKLTEALDEAAALDASLAAFVAPFHEWAERERSGRKIPERVARWTALLQDYAIRRREATKEATLWLPSGKIATTGRKAAPEIEDPEAVVEWARARSEDGKGGGLVETTTRPKAREISEIIRVAERPTTATLLLALECGHEAEILLPDLPTPEEAETPVDVAGLDPVACHACHDVIEGTPLRAPAAASIRVDSRLVVLDPETGEEVPGIGVRPARTTAAVTPGATRGRK